MTTDYNRGIYTRKREGGNNLGIGKLERSANLVLWAEEAFGAYGTGIGVTRPSLIC